MSWKSVSPGVLLNTKGLVALSLAVLVSLPFSLFSGDALFLTSNEKGNGFTHGYIDGPFLKNHIKYFHQHFYVCGPDKMIAALSHFLTCLSLIARISTLYLSGTFLTIGGFVVKNSRFPHTIEAM